MPSLIFQSNVQWYFCFCENTGSLPFWQELFIKGHSKDMTHVFLFTQCGNMIQMVEPQRNYIRLSVQYDGSTKLHARALASLLVERGDKVLFHSFKPKLGGLYSLLNCVPSCVTAAKVGSGIYSKAITPLGLYKDLLRDGAVIISS